MTDKDFDKLSGREILNSFGKLVLEYQYDRVQNIRPKRLLKKFHNCSTTCQNVWIFDGRVKELEEKRLPYRVFRRIEWFEPKEECKK